MEHHHPHRPKVLAWEIKALLLVFTLCIVCGGCSTGPGKRVNGTADRDLSAAGIDRLAGTSQQLVVVIGEAKESRRARLYAVEWDQGSWRVHEGPWRAMIGRNGFAAPGEKREGDGKSPSGLFPLEFVFGYAPHVETRMPYRQATTDDLWVDDAASADYNTWVRRGETAATSFEVMRLPDQQYRHGVVIGYNRNPIVKGKGSAIFMHVWREEGKPTAGCVSMAEGNLLHIIEWLDPDKKPMILMGNEEDLPAITENIGRTGHP